MKTFRMLGELPTHGRADGLGFRSRYVKLSNLKFKIKMETKIKSASVKVMLSYDYSHFEASMSLENDNGLTVKEIDAARKDCQRLADKAVAQYKTAKAQAAQRNDGQYKMKNFEAEL